MNKEQVPLHPLDSNVERSMRFMNEIMNAMVDPASVKAAQEPNPDPRSTQSSPIYKVLFPDEGGILSYLQGFEEPYKGFPHFQFVEGLDGAKKLTKYFFQRLHYILRTMPWWRKMLIRFSYKFFEQQLFALFYALYRSVEQHRIRPERYSDAVREVYRVLTGMAQMANIERGENRILMFRDVFCTYLEFDNAYRFRFQDLMEELDKVQAIKNPAGEIKRIYNIELTRELIEEFREKQAQYRDFFAWLFSKKGYKQLAQEFFRKLNLRKLGLSKEDVQWCRERLDYHFGFCERGEEICVICKGRLENQHLNKKMIQEKIKSIKDELVIIDNELKRLSEAKVRDEAKLELLLTLEREFQAKEQQKEVDLKIEQTKQ